jgi:hypothetical protein
MAMNQLQKHICSLVVVLLAVSLAGCAAAPLPADGVEALFTGSTLYGIEQALIGAPSTFIMRSAFNPNLFLVGWHVQDAGWAFVLLDAEGSAKTWQSVAGNITTPKNITELMNGAIALRFTFVKDLSEASLALCRGYEIAKNWIGQTANSMPVILVAPVAGFELPGILPTPSGIQE